MNLLTETAAHMERAGQSPADVVFIGSTKSGHSCTWEDFARLADVEYHDGFGGQEVATDLIIVFRDGSWMERGEYDGSEWWEFREPFTVPAEAKPILRLVRGEDDCGWSSLAEMNEETP